MVIYLGFGINKIVSAPSPLLSCIIFVICGGQIVLQGSEALHSVGRGTGDHSADHLGPSTTAGLQGVSATLPRAGVPIRGSMDNSTSGSFFPDLNYLEMIYLYVSYLKIEFRVWLGIGAFKPV